MSHDARFNKIFTRSTGDAAAADAEEESVSNKEPRGDFMLLSLSPFTSRPVTRLALRKVNQHAGYRVRPRNDLGLTRPVSISQPDSEIAPVHLACVSPPPNQIGLAL